MAFERGRILVPAAFVGLLAAGVWEVGFRDGVDVINLVDSITRKTPETPPVNPPRKPAATNAPRPLTGKPKPPIVAPDSAATRGGEAVSPTDSSVCSASSVENFIATTAADGNVLFKAQYNLGAECAAKMPVPSAQEVSCRVALHDLFQAKVNGTLEGDDRDAKMFDLGGKCTQVAGSTAESCTANIQAMRQAGSFLFAKTEETPIEGDDALQPDSAPTSTPAYSATGIFKLGQDCGISGNPIR